MPHRVLLAAAAAVVAVASTSAGCLYLPPVHDTAGIKSVRLIEPGTTSRADVRKRFGRPRVLGTQGVYVYDWDQSYGYIVVAGGYSAGGGELKGKHFHAVVFFEDDRVAYYAWDSDPPLEAETAQRRFVPAAVLAPQPLTLPGGGEPESICVAFSADLARCLVASDATGSAWIAARGRDAGRLAPPWKPRPGTPPWERQMVSPDDRLLVAERRRASRKWAGWHLEDGRPFPLRVEGRDLSPLAFSADGAVLAAERRGGKVVVLDAREGHLLLRTRPFKARLQSASFASDRIAVSTTRGDLALLERATGAVTVRLESRSSLPDGRTVALSPDGRLLAASTSTALELWDVPALEAQQRQRQEPLATSDDGPATALRAVSLFPAADAGESAVAFSADGALVAAGTGRHVLVTPAQGGSEAWLEMAAGATGRSLLPDDWWTAAGAAWNAPPAVSRVRFSPDGKRAIVLFGKELLSFDPTFP